ncbi:hypothetical protein COU13_01110 [Candidatus Kaiserbacteria bacterium CG10_big_fil_rev_8_21_14_0_10_43_70]|uniref:Cell wall hydrolase SleB domain-containing protein n=1 Tax=Candidatus Kaiserbacteria bacterium CG10_big_fil_rev_8_21_14_0_10_43_70 TaxID=1974605 RepID=A0A2H0UL60_9BACT|nr:MAG: hypothetical protein COU13_01110 [Candidatus Kaiserbacteria bacterium CG10_big_fil_rev_8_21_14_0_10_43_70]
MKKYIALAIALIFLFESLSPMHWLALTMYFESRDESFVGRLAVANVVHNRVRDNRWPDSIRGVVTDGLGRGKSCDFSFMCDGKSENPWRHRPKHWMKWLQIRAEAYIIWLAYLIATNPDVTDGAVFYKRHDTKSPWFEKEIKADKIELVQKNLGAHEFYKFK